MSAKSDVPHPGVRIRAEVIPGGMSVTKAAQFIGVGRPALSNLLNGNAALSEEMAMRLEKAFRKFTVKALMEMQARYNAARANQKETPSNTKAYVPPFLAIKANDIEGWVSHNIPARSRLAVFLRTLVHSTGSGLTLVDFPGNDDAERPGWDGITEASEGTPWVPAERSGWEFGTNEDPKTKAEADFQKSVKAISKKARAGTTFVFVTPRRWAGKGTWVTAKKARGLWKDVRVYDASDLEQWLEQSLPGQAWFANETNIPAHDVRSLEKCWADWSDVASPPLTGALFNLAIEAAKQTVLTRLSRPAEGPILIAADSTDEALAFLAQLLGERGGKELAEYRDRVLVFDKPGILPRLAAAAQTFIPVVFTREVERELGPYAKSMHSFVVYPRNATTSKPDITLQPANYETFNKALEEMGKDRDEISRLTSASGRSLTVLRRQLSHVPPVRTPKWAEERSTATSLVPFLLVGAWDRSNETDKQSLSLLAGDRSYDDLEKACQNLTQLNDAPMWSINNYRGVVSKIDLLYAIAGAVTADDLKRYFSLAQMVLGEDDPALDLPDEQRWAAPIHGKTREFSAAFREGISETLVLLAVHGRHLFRNLGVDPEVEAIRVVRDLLQTPLTTRKLEANDRDLPTYAEAAPDEFLSILERDLRSNDPAVLGLLRPASTGVFAHPSRTGLLWALEGLSWDPQTLPRAAFVLARLAQIEIDDNWVNKPTNSLASIFRAWMPQTAADHEERVALIKKIAEKFPDVAWQICVHQFGNHFQTGSYSHKPRWRADGYGFGEPIRTRGPIVAFIRDMIEMALTWEDHSLGKLCDLIERLQDLAEADQARVWALVEAWAKTKASDADKAALREKIRVSTLSRRAALRARKKETALELARAGKAAYAALEPSDLLNKHGWLFRDGYVQESADDIENVGTFDIHKYQKEIENLRIAALREIKEELGLAGILRLSDRGNASWVIGGYAASTVLSPEELQELLQLALTPIVAGKEDVHLSKNLIAGALRAVLNDEKREAVITQVAADLSEEEIMHLLLLAPFGRSTWKAVDARSEDTQAKYWGEVTPERVYSSVNEAIEAAERLLKAERARAAFSCIQFEAQKLDGQILFRVLSAMAQGSKDKPGQHMLEHFWVEEAFKQLNKDPTLTVDQKAGLEFAYVDVLGQPWGTQPHYGIPNLERYVEAHPELFVQAIVWTYKRKDKEADPPDPPDFQVPKERAKDMAERGYKLLDVIKRIPGHNDLGQLDSKRLATWIAKVRQSCAKLSRADIADNCIGKVLSYAPLGGDGVWPCEPVRDVMDEIQSERLMQGAHTGVYNQRGAHWRGSGGEQERELAEKYRLWGKALQISHPFVSSKLLMALSETYSREATREDADAEIRNRLR